MGIIERSTLLIIDKFYKDYSNRNGLLLAKKLYSWSFKNDGRVVSQYYFKSSSNSVEGTSDTKYIRLYIYDGYKKLKLTLKSNERSLMNINMDQYIRIYSY